MKRERESADYGVPDTPLLHLHEDYAQFIKEDSDAQELVRPYYTDLNYLHNRLHSRSRLFRRAPHIADQAQTAFDTDDEQDILKVVAELSAARGEFMPKGNPVQTVLSVLTTGRELQRIRDKVSPLDIEERRRVFMTYNVLSTFDMRSTAIEVPGDDLLRTYQVINHFIRLTTELGQRANDQEVTLDSGVLEYFRQMIGSRYVTREYVKRLPGNDSETPSAERVKADSEMTSMLFQEALQTRRFGMKMGYIHDHRGGSLVFGNISNLTFAPGLDTHRMIDDMYHVSEALVVHSEKRNFRNIKIKTREVGSRDNVRTSMIDLSELSAINDVHLGKDGELYNDATCNDPLLPTAVELGKYTAYRDLQATILSHYFDLTHSYEEVTAIKKAEKVSAATTRTTNEPTELISKLLIPRVRYNPEEQNQDNGESPDDSEAERSHRTVRRHDVTWHIRKLPEGWNASPAALQLAREINVTLEPNETIVKDHKRGSRLLGEVVGHKLINRA